MLVAVSLVALLGVGVVASPAWAQVPGTPGQPSVSPGNGQITVTFSAPASNGGKPITSYTASCAPVDSVGIFGHATNAGEVAPIVVTGLTNGAGYTCSVHATNASGASNESFNSAVVFVGAPATPAQPLAIAGHAQITVAFSAPADNGNRIVSYTARCSSSTGVAGSNTGAASPIVITVLTNGASYTCTVTARNSVGTSLASPASVAVTPFLAAPSAPATPSAARGDTKIAVIFNAPADNGGSPITGYTASCSSGSGASGAAVGTGSPITVPGLTNGASYTCTVSATNALGTSPPSAPSAPAVPAPVPDAPSQPSVIGGSSGISVAFTAPPDNGTPITSYTATCVSNNGGAPASRSGAGSPITVTGLTTARIYTCTVTATSAVGTGPPSPPSADVIPTTVPAAPTLRAAAPRDGAAIVSFTPNNTGGVNTNFAAACTSTNSGAPGLISGPRSPITVPGLSNGKTYTCSVRATNPIGGSDPSARSRPFVVGTPGAPVITHVVSALARGSRAALNVTFNPGPSNGSAVSAFRATCRQDFTGAVTVGSSLRSPIPVGDLLNGHGYTCSVVATNTRGASATSNAVHATVGTPAVPPLTRALSIRNGVVVAFGAPGSNGGSPVRYYQERCTSANGGVARSQLQLVSPMVADNLTVGRTYTCALAAVNDRGAGAPAITGPIVVSATQPAQICHAASGLLHADPGVQFGVPESQTLALGATFGNCSGPYVQRARLFASFRTKSISCQTAVGVSSGGSATLTWTAPAGLGMSVASIQLTIASTAGHTTLATFGGTVTSRTNLFSNARVSGTIIFSRGLGATSSGGDCPTSGRIDTLPMTAMTIVIS